MGKVFCIKKKEVTGVWTKIIWSQWLFILKNIY